MGTEVKFPLAEEGDKYFLSHVFIEVEGNDVFIGLTKRNGDAYAYTRISREKLCSALEVLEIIKEE